MKSKNNTILYFILCIIIIGVAYTACKDITPEQQRVEQDIELKLSK